MSMTLIDPRDPWRSIILNLIYLLFTIDMPQTKGPFIPLPTGRRDGNRSVAADVAPNSPPPGATIADIIALFATKFNLTAKDLAVLSGI